MQPLCSWSPSAPRARRPSVIRRCSRKRTRRTRATRTDEDAQLPDRLRKQIVGFDRSEPAGTIVIDTNNTYLYYVLGNGRAIRYGVGVGREGFTWSGVKAIGPVHSRDGG